jgi:hypothetical protein
MFLFLFIFGFWIEQVQFDSSFLKHLSSICYPLYNLYRLFLFVKNLVYSHGSLILCKG